MQLLTLVVGLVLVACVILLFNAEVSDTTVEAIGLITIVTVCVLVFLTGGALIIIGALGIYGLL